MNAIAAPSVVEWHGPFSSINDARKATQANVANVENSGIGIYMSIGRPNRGLLSRLLTPFVPDQIAYVGIGVLKDRLDANRAEFADVANLSVWVGWLKSMPSPNDLWNGRKHDPKLDDAEWAIAYFLNPVFNEKKTASPPPRPVLIQNRWVSSGKSMISPHKRWPDILAWPVLPPKHTKLDILPIDLRGLGIAAFVWLAPRQVVRLTERI